MTKHPSDRDRFRVVAIDGGAASGKSSTSRALASRCGFLHVDTGSHYRAVTHVCLLSGIPPNDGLNLRRFLSELSFETVVDKRESLIAFAGFPGFSEADLRSAEVNRNVSQFAALPLIREAVKVYQREQVNLARTAGFKGIVMDGRDIGTVILPEADPKIFLTADPTARQKRRSLEGGVDTIADRDKFDSSRVTAPLRPAEDAVIIDNSCLSLDEVVERIIRLLA